MRASVHQTSAGGLTDVPFTAIADVPQLTRRMRAGEEAAFREFYHTYYDRLFRYLLVVAAGELLFEIAACWNPHTGQPSLRPTSLLIFPRGEESPFIVAPA